MDPGLPDVSLSRRRSLNEDYRTDIDGLRAIAVVAVVLFHFSFAGWNLPSGFFGVDVFFVISGYLITGLIRDAVEAGQFSLRRFYRRRFQRLAPALLALLALSLGAGYLLLMPADFAELGRSARYTLFALSNFYFYGATGYFDQAAHLQPLLHTWSLAIEEQFYLVWPLLLLALHRLGGRRWTIIGISVITLSSFVYCLLLVRWEQSAAFYSPLARAWELAAGGLLTFAAPMPGRYRLPEWATGIGLALLLVALLTPVSTATVPGVSTLLPVAATLLLVYPKAGPPRLASPLSWPAVRYVGRISYSLYLWHWPVLVLGLHYNAEQPLSPLFSLTLLMLALLLAIVAYHGIETPLRYHRFPGRQGVLAALTAVCLVSLGATHIMQSDGLPERIYADGRPLLDRNYQWAWQPASESDTGWRGKPAFGAPWRDASQRVVLWGDSHAAHMAPLLEQIIVRQQRSTSVLLASGCPPTIDGERFVAVDRGEKFNTDCARERAAMLQFLKTSPLPIDKVVLAVAWATRWQMHDAGGDGMAGYGQQQEALQSTVEALRAAGVAVSVIGQIPLWPRDPTLCVASRLDGLWRRDCTPTLRTTTMPIAFAPVHELLQQLADSGIQVLLPHRRLCTADRCLTELAGEFLYRDADHLRRNLNGDILAEYASRAGLDGLL